MWFAPAFSGLFFSAARACRGGCASLPAWLSEYRPQSFRDSIADHDVQPDLPVASGADLDGRGRTLHRRAYSSPARSCWNGRRRPRRKRRRDPRPRSIFIWNGPRRSPSLSRTGRLAGSARGLAGCAAPLLLLWALSRPFSSWLNRRPARGHSRLDKDDVQLCASRPTASGASSTTGALRPPTG